MLPEILVLIGAGLLCSEGNKLYRKYFIIIKNIKTLLNSPTR